MFQYVAGYRYGQGGWSFLVESVDSNDTSISKPVRSTSQKSEPKTCRPILNQEEIYFVFNQTCEKAPIQITCAYIHVK